MDAHICPCGTTESRTQVVGEFEIYTLGDTRCVSRGDEEVRRTWHGGVCLVD